jgi:hypothetical protein
MYIRVAPYKAINLKRETYYTIQKSYQSPNNFIALSEVYAITKKWLRLIVSSEKIWGEKGWVRQLSKESTTNKSMIFFQKFQIKFK